MHIVITGVTRGLGRALAEWYIAHGHTVSGCGRNGMEIFELRSTYTPSRTTSMSSTSREPVKVGMWSERILVAGRPGFLINNAGP
jgi:NAD(P)-dependent dehydrogenase (short-subunit alcohol dehydrogenase family)